MSSKLPILLVVAGVIYFISTASAEDGDDVGCMDEAACNYDDTATVDSGDCKYGDACDDDDDGYTPTEHPCDNVDTSLDWRTVASDPATNFDVDRDSNYSAWGLEKTRIKEVRVDQRDYIPGSQVDIEFDTQVRNKSESRCGDGFWGHRTCWFAPTRGSTVGANEGHLRFSVMIVPHGSTVVADQEMFNGDTKFIEYSNQDDVEADPPPSPCDGEDVCKVFKDARARYGLNLTIPSNTTSLGSYDIIIRTGLQTSWNAKAFRGIAVIPNAFNVEECETPSEAENYETRFMSNQSFMTL